MKRLVFAALLTFSFVTCLMPVAARAQTWTQMESNTNNHLKGVWGVSGSNVFAVGEAATVIRYNGSMWNSDTVDTANLNAVWGSSASNVFAVGDNGAVRRWNGTKWSTDNRAGIQSLYGVSGSPGANVYAVGNTGVVQIFNGTSWTLGKEGSVDLYAVWVSSGGEVFAVGVGGAVRQYNVTWNNPTKGINDFNAVWGSSASDVFAVGNSGTVYHFNGTSWSQQISNTTQPLYGVWGSSDKNVYAVGKSGTIIHYNGTSWSAVNPNPTSYDLYAVWGSSSNDIFAVGAHGTVLHYGSGTPLTTTTTGSGTTTTIHGTTTTIHGSTTTTIGDGSTTSTIIYVQCPISRAAGSSAHTYRQLRDARLTAAIGAYMAAAYYQNLPEVSGILRDDEALRSRFGSMILRQVPAVRDLFERGGTRVSAEDLNELYEFLADMRMRAGPKLRMDIDFILRGFESGWLPRLLGIEIEQDTGNAGTQ